VRKADNLTAICEPTAKTKGEASTSHTPMGLNGLLQGQLYLIKLVLQCGVRCKLCVSEPVNKITVDHDVCHQVSDSIGLEFDVRLIVRFLYGANEVHLC
jgi:hypothetical protein